MPRHIAAHPSATTAATPLAMAIGREKINAGNGLEGRAIKGLTTHRNAASAGMSRYVRPSVSLIAVVRRSRSKAIRNVCGAAKLAGRGVWPLIASARRG